jgi:hypothetical protein
MRLAIFAVAAALAVSTAASAAPASGPAQAPPPMPTPPRVFALAGYTEPMIPATSCKNVNASETQCLIPSMTAGRYLADATGVSTATADGAAQQITIVAGDQRCTATYNPDPKKPWAVGAKRSFHAGCVFALVSDAPMLVTVLYLDGKATKDPAGPSLALLPQQWTGAFNAVPVSFPQSSAP